MSIETVNQGKFIVFEGIGGCGKGTQIEMLRKHLEDKRKSVLVTCEHTRDTSVGQLIEKTIKRESMEIDPTALQILYVADRVNHTSKVIKPALENNDVVLADRYKGSTISYAPIGERFDFLNMQNGLTLTPDLVIILDLDPMEAAKRIEKRGDADIFDKAERLRVCLEGYEWYSDNTDDPVAWVDGSGTKEEVHERIKYEIKTRKILD